MKCEAIFKVKTVATVCYVTALDISLVGFDWIDMFDVLKPKKYQRTEEFGQADGLSRLVENQPAESKEVVAASVSTERDVQQILAELIRNTPVSAEDIRKETEKDAVLQQAAMNPICQYPVLCLQTEILWTRSSTTNRGDLRHNDWSTGTNLLDARVAKNSSFRQWDTVYISRFQGVLPTTINRTHQNPSVPPPVEWTGRKNLETCRLEVFKIEWKEIG
ncbi:unnamed protein product [Hymenolepis diminuta]|uniref:Retrotransposon protein, putative, unclassified n=1 Tax=Hymenolepis diminuta TaxID=6216 RepID=A0A0R3SF20_HYMDI|nr:unnamed protein product [Hymenolepis diminuta]